MDGALRVGTFAGPWKITHELGRGGAGVVYGAQDADFEGIQAAIKVLEEHSPLQERWLRREASLAARLRHRHIVQVLGVGHFDDGWPWVAFERVNGATLEAIAGDLDGEAIRRIGAQLLDALGYAHDAGVLHQDLSPSNVLVAASAPHDAKLTDFGLAQLRDHHDNRMNRSGLVAGTPGYLSPEQTLGSVAVGPRSDIYALGAVLYRLIAGHPPHFGADATEVLRRTRRDDALPLVPRSGLNVSRELCALIMQMLARDPAERPRSAHAARERWLATKPRGTQVRPSAPAPSTEDLTEAPTLVGLEISQSRSTMTAPKRRSKVVPRRWSLAPMLGDPELVPRIIDATATRGLQRITGPRGIGKTRTLQALVQEAHRRDWCTAQSCGRRRSTNLPLEGIAPLALSLLDAGPTLPPWAAAETLAVKLSELEEHEGISLELARDAFTDALVGSSRRPPGSGAALEAYRTINLLRAPGRPLLLCIDDACHLDAESENVLETLARQEDIHVVLAQRTSRKTEVWELPPLVPADARTLLGVQPEPASTLIEELGGIPGDLSLAKATLSTHRSLGRLGIVDAVLAGLDEDERTLLEIAALLREAPRRSLVPIAEAIAHRSIDASAVDRLLRRTLLQSNPFACARLETWVHIPSPLLEEQLRTRLSASSQQTMAAAAARWLRLECFDGSPGVLRLVGEFAELGGQLRCAAYAYAEAGLRAHHLGESRGPALLQQALELAEAHCPEAVDTPALLAALADDEVRSGQPQLALEHCERALSQLESGRQVLGARLHNLRGRAHTETRDLDRAVGAYQEAIVCLGTAGDPEQRATALASWGWIRGYLQGRTEEGIALQLQAQEVAAEIDAPAFQARLCGRLGAAQLRAGDWNGQLATNLRDLGLSSLARDPWGVVRAHINIGVCHQHRGHIALSRAHTEAAAELALTHGALSAAQVAYNNLAQLAVDGGRTEEAQAAIAETERLAALRGVPVHAETLGVKARLGPKGELPGLLAAMLEAADGAETPLVARLHSLLCPNLPVGDHADAAAHLRHCLQEGIDDPYDRITTELCAATSPEGQSKALKALERLGADPELERRRWLPQARSPFSPQGIPQP